MSSNSENGTIIVTTPTTANEPVELTPEQQADLTARVRGDLLLEGLGRLGRGKTRGVAEAMADRFGLDPAALAKSN